MVLNLTVVKLIIGPVGHILYEYPKMLGDIGTKRIPFIVKLTIDIAKKKSFIT